MLTLSNGGLSGALIYSNLSIMGNTLVITNATGNPTNHLSATINRNTGVVTLTFRRTGAAANTTAQGVLLQTGTTNAAGVFVAPKQSGYFLLQNQ